MLKLLRKFTKKDWLNALICIFFIVVQVWLSMTMPQYMSKITVLVETPGSQMGDVAKAGLLMMLCALGSLLASVITNIFSSLVGSSFAFTLRDSIFKKVGSFSMAEIGKFSTSSLITRSTNDTQQVLMFIVMGMQMLILAPITAIWAIIKIINKAWQWKLSLSIAIVILFMVVGTCIALTMPRFKKMQELTDNLNRVTRENLTGLKVVRAYNAEEYQENKFEKANEALTSTQLFTQRTMSFMMPTIQLVMSGITLVVYLVGASIMGGMETMQTRIALFGDMMVFSQYGMQIVIAFMMLVSVLMLYPRASVSSKRINEVLETKNEIVNGTKKEGRKGEEGSIEFKHVSFIYPDAEEYVLHDISFKANKGETVAFIGSTGCGKSTVINLIPRFYDATEGEVLVDGVNVKEYDEKALRNKIAYVSQTATLFSGSIESNITYGDNGKEKIGKEEIEEAIEIAQAKEFVDKKEDGISSFVAQGGTNFSGGQKQRLSIARALARKSEIIIFDDSFSALDYKTDRKLRDTLDEKCKDTTRLIVAQRIGTIRGADKIIVLDEGKVVGEGKHEELLKSCSVYKEIALSQLSEEELR